MHCSRTPCDKSSASPIPPTSERPWWHWGISKHRWQACDILAYLSINHRAVGRRIGWPEPEQQTRTSPRLPAPAPASAPLPSSTSHSPRHARRPTSQVSRRASLISRSRLPTSTADGFLASNARSSAIDNLALAHLAARRPQLPVAARPLPLPASHPNAPSPKL